MQSPGKKNVGSAWQQCRAGLASRGRPDPRAQALALSSATVHGAPHSVAKPQTWGAGAWYSGANLEMLPWETPGLQGAAR